MTQPQATNKTSTEHIFNVTLPSLELAKPEQARNQNRTHEASLFLYYKYVKQHQYEIHEASNITKQTSYFSTCSLALRIIISVQWCHWQLNNGLQDKSDKSDKTHANQRGRIFCHGISRSVQLVVQSALVAQSHMFRDSRRTKRLQAGNSWEFPILVRLHFELGAWSSLAPPPFKAQPWWSATPGRSAGNSLYFDALIQLCPRSYRPGIQKVLLIQAILDILIMWLENF